MGTSSDEKVQGLRHMADLTDDEARRLGLDQPITRRDFVKGALVGSGAALLGMPAPALRSRRRRRPRRSGRATPASAITRAPTAIHTRLARPPT